MALDVVCRMDVDEATHHRSEHDGRTYFFCGPGCKRRFDSEPKKYVELEE